MGEMHVARYLVTRDNSEVVFADQVSRLVLRVHCVGDIWKWGTS